MISFWISVVPPKIVVTNVSVAPPPPGRQILRAEAARNQFRGHETVITFSTECPYPLEVR
jgi:hypothetical protein